MKENRNSYHECPMDGEALEDMINRTEGFYMDSETRRKKIRCIRELEESGKHSSQRFSISIKTRNQTQIDPKLLAHQVTFLPLQDMKHR